MTDRDRRLKAAQRAYKRWTDEKSEDAPPGGEFHMEAGDDSRYYVLLSEELDAAQAESLEAR